MPEIKERMVVQGMTLEEFYDWCARLVPEFGWRYEVWPNGLIALYRPGAFMHTDIIQAVSQIKIGVTSECFRTIADSPMNNFYEHSAAAALLGLTADDTGRILAASIHPWGDKEIRARILQALG